MLSKLVLKYLVLAEPQSDFFLRTFDSIGAVADISANVLFQSVSFLRHTVLQALSNSQWHSPHGWCLGQMPEGW